MIKLVSACAVPIVLASCAAAGRNDVRAELAPTGTLRAGINVGNAILVAKDATTGELHGIAPEVARELGRRLNVPVALLPYDSAAAVADDAGSGRWDVAFIGSDPARAAAIAFTAPYVELQSTYLVLTPSPIKRVADVDAPGVRVAARPRTAYDLVLRRSLKNATLVYPSDGETDLALVTSGKADALAGLRQVLIDTATTLPGARVLDDDFTAIQQAIGVPKARAAAASYLQAFVADIKESGFLADVIDQSGARGASVARD